MQINELNIDFMGKRRMAIILSGSMILISLIMLAVRGLSFGIDFTGGTLIEVAYEQPADLNDVRTRLSNGGFGDAQTLHFGTTRDVLVRIAPQEGVDQAALSTKVVSVLSEGGLKVDVRRVEFVGPQVGDELAEEGAMAMLIALFGILIYVTFRFEYRFSLGAVAALVHDVIITLGFFALTQIEFDLTVLAALLAVIGYSLNDTIVVFDRIRENFRKIRKGTAKEIMNVSINQTLSRTLMTSGTTLLVLIALATLGGEVINAFALALIVGIVVGTYSSIYVAGTTALVLGVSKQDLMPQAKPAAEGAEGADQP
ncbi:MAG: protein translocase subunit SecF [Chromatiales bacterium]|nr:protein translocase subunit SecF [Gammaproteobacteria bacterium]MCP5351688.1 protein translocase subunit SecF [Chromatiales bacterium]